MPADKRSGMRATKDVLTTHLIEDRRASISPWGKGNPKLGPGVYTYSKLPGRVGGSCPGSTAECELICYAKRIVFNKPVWDLWTRNTIRGDELPPLPPDAKIVRFHVSGDFDSIRYIIEWCKLVNRNLQVRFFGYTRSWRVPELVPWLLRLRDYPNVQLFASVDQSMRELPPKGWRRAWLENDRRAVRKVIVDGQLYWADDPATIEDLNDYQTAYVCPEETGRKPDCVSCGYCIRGKRGDVIFLIH